MLEVEAVTSCPTCKKTGTQGWAEMEVWECIYCGKKVCNMAKDSRGPCYMIHVQQKHPERYRGESNDVSQ